MTKLTVPRAPVRSANGPNVRSNGAVPPARDGIEGDRFGHIILCRHVGGEEICGGQGHGKALDQLPVEGVVIVLAAHLAE
ncbi:hypothetical protein [Sphingomonas daechungensis]|uniref:hypothetical protein n=1 Tax=Sphingomonas daechungensis TaxID=1176646 RepID=UPI0037844CE9